MENFPAKVEISSDYPRSFNMGAQKYKQDLKTML